MVLKRTTPNSSVEIWTEKHPTHSSCSGTRVLSSYCKLMSSWNNRDDNIVVVMIPLCVGLDEQYLSKTTAALVGVGARRDWCLRSLSYAVPCPIDMYQYVW
jgi:hypothetical protein